jgi:NarL family two-component system response regulator LiaR
MDIVMPELDGIDAIREIRARNSDARILVLTTFTTDDKLFPAIEAGASGYLLKNTEPEELVRAIRQVHDGDYSLSQTIAQRVLQRISWRSEAPPATDPLTEREVEVLALIARGLANRQIAEKLVISEATVRTHVGHILGKLHLASRTQAALYALREGLASLFDEGGGE